jgi:hypothetical protein
MRTARTRPDVATTVVAAAVPDVRAVVIVADVLPAGGFEAAVGDSVAPEDDPTDGPAENWPTVAGVAAVAAVVMERLLVIVGAAVATVAFDVTAAVVPTAVDGATNTTPPPPPPVPTPTTGVGSELIEELTVTSGLA